MRSRRLWEAVGTAALLISVVSACSNAPKASSDGSSQGPTSSPSATESSAQITSSIPANATGVKVNRSLRLNVSDGTFTQVQVTGKSGPVQGALSTDKLTWQSTARLQPGETYAVRGSAVDAHGTNTTYRA